LNISEHVEHHAEGVEHVPSVQHVDVAADQNVNVHDVALSGKKNACYVVLVLNYSLELQLKKDKEYANLSHSLVLATDPPLVQQPPAPPKRRSHRNLTLHVPEEEENDADMDAPMSAFLKRAQKNKKKK
jgi:hypothetical protein